ncbi:MAG: hypothetical protein IJX99_02290 [Clostridia bacterium]|nr:hypothetical protein [Clostridia bacterium]
MTTNPKYVRYPSTPALTKKERDEIYLAQMTRSERHEFFMKFHFHRKIFNTIIAWFVCMMLLGFPFLSDALTALYPDTYAGLHNAAEIILANPDATDQLPAGYWIDEGKTTERILCIKAWDGSWMTWSWSSSHPWMELQHGSGWFFPIMLGLSTLVCGVVLGSIVTKIVPLKHSLLWRFSEFA